LWLAAYAIALWLHRQGRLARDYHRDVLALGVIALATLGFFWQLFFTDDTWMPSGGGDLVSFLYPLYHFAARNLRRGIIPLWNPYLYGGAPFAADNQSGLFYPVNLLFFVLFPDVTYPTMELLAVFHFFLAGAFMYICLRSLKPEQVRDSGPKLETRNPKPETRHRLSRSAALAGAIAFMFSDLFITHFGNLNMIAVAAWLPLIFLCYHRAMTEERPGMAVAAGAFLGLATLAGHIQITLFIVLMLALYTLYQGRQRGNEERGNEKKARRGLSFHPFLHSLTRYLLPRYLVPCCLVAFCTAALALIPSYEMASYTVRAEMSYGEASQYSLPPVGLVGLFVPGFFGRGPAGFWGPWDRVEVGYVGVLSLILAALAVLLRHDRLTRFLLGLAIISLLLAFGGFAILHGWLYLLPGFDKRWLPGSGWA
jgi:hypothetical protein